VSGLTTTGATVLTGLDSCRCRSTFWRTQLVWLGGMGLIVLAVAILPLLGIGGRQMFKAETPGPMKDSSLTPRIAETAKGLWGVYAGVTVLLHPGLPLGRHELARCRHAHVLDHGPGRLFQPRRELRLFRTRRHRGGGHRLHADRRDELRDPLSRLSGRVRCALPARSGGRLVSSGDLGSVFGIAVYLGLSWDVYPEFRRSLAPCGLQRRLDRHHDRLRHRRLCLWPIFAPLWMLFLCSFATSAGSTGGGIKMIRAIILYKQVYRELVRAMHPTRSGR
jgi:trk system potassium uptake protein TrkH